MPRTGEVVHVLEVDPDLGEGLNRERELFARMAAVARVDLLEPGEWRGDEEYPATAGHLGLLVLEGLLAREMRVGDRVCIELLGPGDLLRPWVKVAAYSSVPIDSHWTVVEPTRIAVLDRRFAATIARFPEIAGTILDRMMARSRWLALHLAVCHLRLIEERLLVMLWHFARESSTDPSPPGQATDDALTAPSTQTVTSCSASCDAVAASLAVNRLD